MECMAEIGWQAIRYLSRLYLHRGRQMISCSAESTEAVEDNIDLSEYEDIDGLFREYKNIVLTETERRG